MPFDNDVLEHAGNFNVAAMFNRAIGSLKNLVGIGRAYIRQFSVTVTYKRFQIIILALAVQPFSIMISEPCCLVRETRWPFTRDIFSAF